MKELLLEIKERLEELNKLKEDYEIKSFINKIKKKLTIIEYKEKYDIDLKEYNFRGLDHIFIDDYYGILYINKNMEVLNSEKQPDKEELLFEYCFPTGAFIFGDDYNEKTFDEFFEELKSYNYRYIDEMNSCLYFDIETGCKLFRDYEKICKKYQDIHDEREKINKIKRLQEELKELEGEENENN